MYLSLREDIVSGKLKPDEKLKLTALLKTYKVSMAPLREALSRLVGDMLVVTQGQRGFWVAPLSVADLDDVTFMRASLETQALSMSIQRGDDAWGERVKNAYSALEELEAQLPDSPEDMSVELGSKWERLNQQFHENLVSACGSPWLLRMREILYRQSERYRRISISQGRGHRNIEDEHRSIFSAAQKRNTLKACELIEYHMQATADEVRRALIHHQDAQLLSASRDSKSG